MKLFWLIGTILLFALTTAPENRAQVAKQNPKSEIRNPKSIDLTVASDGSGNAKSVQEAIDKIPENNQKRFTIFIKAGVYQEQIRIPSTKPYVSLVGESAEKTKLTFNLPNKIAGSTSAAYAFYVGGHDFYAENMTFENSFGTGSQAVAVLAEADRAVFKNCRFLGWQDTLYAKNGRQYYENCYIEGHVDFIFGQAAAVFENCTIHSERRRLHRRADAFCRGRNNRVLFLSIPSLTGENTNKGVYLGRPWRDYGRTVFLETEMGAHIRAEGWNHWAARARKDGLFRRIQFARARRRKRNARQMDAAINTRMRQKFSSRKTFSKARTAGIRKKRILTGNKKPRPITSWFRGATF